MRERPTGHIHFDFAELGARERYKLLIGTIIPRPIAFITTVGADGRHNAAPFSFFNILTHDPPIVAVGLEYRADGSPKDTARNILERGEFTIHIVDDALAAQMEICAIKFGPEVDELAEAGLTALAGTLVRTPRIAEAPAALECRLNRVLDVSRDRQIILGDVLGVFIRDDAVDPATHRIDQHRMDAIGRLGGWGYARTSDQFEMRTLSVEEYEAGKGKGQR